METFAYLLLTLVLLLLNGFFVLVEFAAVKMRPTRVEELLNRGDARAGLFQHIQTHIDEYLSVCQVGITLASIGLGFVGEAAFAEMVRPVVAWAGISSSTVVHGTAIAISYLLVSFLHILIGEQVPKLMGISRPDWAALTTARPIHWCRVLFYVPLVVLNGAANFILKLLGFSLKEGHSELSQEEIKIVLGRSQDKGMLSFRQLLLFENVFDLKGMKARDAMRLRSEVKTLHAAAPWEEILKTARETRLSRFPLMEGSADAGRPIGIVHVKDLLYEGPARAAAEIRKKARPFVVAREDTALESLLGELQRSRRHVAIVTDAQGKWTGFLTLEDILEEIIGTIEDEFEVEPPIFLADALNLGRIVLGVEAATIPEAVRRALARVPPGDLPQPAGKIADLVIERERLLSTYLGRGLAIPHARLEGIERPVVVFARPARPIPVEGHNEKAEVLFILLTPVAHPRMQVRLLARIAGLFESGYVEEHLRAAETPQAVLEAIRTGDTAALG